MGLGGHDSWDDSILRLVDKETFDWRCPHCGRYACITDDRYEHGVADLTLSNRRGPLRLEVVFIVCPNPTCKEVTLTVSLCVLDELYRRRGKFEREWQLIPPSQALAVPDYVPESVRRDYLEACIVLDGSPKAAATLARRCLQGMIRDFWGVRGKRNLFEEIEAIKDRVDPLTLKAIDSVRKMGNIGAHMEQDINLMIDIEPREASLLIWLVERLIRDWYIDRYEKQQALEAIVSMPEAKKPD